ncbi:MAG: cobalamin biosynthesis protein [Campylobacterota bacterium]|nr:cobalamin biosynthesis protein [Campylobacterota bacterium]
MSNVLVVLFAYVLDKLFGELVSKKHPVVYMGEFITWFQENYYKNSVERGLMLVVLLLLLALGLTYSVVEYLSFLSPVFKIILTGMIASMFISHKVLYDTLKVVALSSEPQKRENISEDDVYKVAIESYSEKLSSGVVAPLLYLLLFGLYGAVFYKVVNTLSLMTAHKTENYNLFASTSVKLDDWLNYIPSRATALLIATLSSGRGFLKYFKDAQKHNTPNARYPIIAMAVALNVKLGKSSSCFTEGCTEVVQHDVLEALRLSRGVDKVIITALTLLAGAVFFL